MNLWKQIEKFAAILGPTIKTFYIKSEWFNINSNNLQYGAHKEYVLQKEHITIHVRILIGSEMYTPMPRVSIHFHVWRI